MLKTQGKIEDSARVAARTGVGKENREANSVQ